MRLFVVDSIPLRELASLADGPRPGDVVTFWRHAQDINGTAAEELRACGITVEWAEGRIDDHDIEQIDEFIDHFGRNWHLRNREDVTVSEGFSFAESITRDLHSRAKINFLVRYGHIYEDIFRSYPGITEIVTDFIDGANWLTGAISDPPAFQRRQLLDHRAKLRGIQCRDLPVQHRIPALGCHGAFPIYRQMIRSFIGGFRPRYVIGQLCLRFSRKKRPRIYLFLTPGLREVAKSLDRRSDVVTLADWHGIKNVTPLRYDHLIGFPSLASLRAVARLQSRIREIEKNGFDEGLATTGAIDYTPYFLASLKHLSRHTVLPTLNTHAQMRRMIKIGKPDLAVINGEGSNAARLTIGLAKKYEFQVVFIEHSHTLVHYGNYPHSRNFPHVIYVAQGDDHVESYGRRLPADRKPWRPILTNPNTIAMAQVRGRRPQPRGKRILLTNYSSAPTYTVARIPFEDRFVIDLFEAARMLTHDGYQFTYRPHPGYHNPAYIDYMLREMGLADEIRIDDAKTFPESLLKHDLVVVNVSGCFYQALYAGWPTIFYEPGFKPHQFVGLPAATDIERPTASTPEQLAQLITQGVTQPDCLTARFPELFSTVYAHRFIGRDADRADEVIATFLVQDVLNKTGPNRTPCTAPVESEAAE